MVGYLATARAEGARVLTGGGPPESVGDALFVAPTVLDDVRPDHRVANEEIFGPVLTLLRWTEGTEAVARARLARMTPLSRQALLLTAMEGFTPEDAAYLIEVDTSEVETLVAEALAEIEKQTRDEYGEEQFMLWRRSYDTPPPPISESVAEPALASSPNVVLRTSSPEPPRRVSLPTPPTMMSSP